MSLTILLEIGHDASLRSKTTAEGFTHDWEVFVKGQNGADIHYYVDKVVFYLHETFPNPKRVVKEPPFSLRTSGYAGFKLPIEIYLKNNQEPKRIKFNYELYLQPTGPPIHRTQKEKYTFFNPSEEFRSKLLKGGAIEGGGSNHEISVNRVEKNQMTSKPKLSGSDFPKKPKMKVEEPRTTDFENLFGPPIKKTSKIPEVPKLKEPPPPKPPNMDKSIDKEKNDKIKSNKSTHKDKEKPKEKSSDSLEKKNKDERKKFKDDKSKDKDRSKEKSSKKEREKSPLSRPRSPTPKRSPKRDLSPLPVQKHSSSKEKETNKEEKKDKERDKDNKREEKKSKKDKRDHKEGKHKDRDREKDHRDHKNKESKSREKEPSVIKQKEASPVPPATVLSQNAHKTDKKPKEKEQTKEDDKIERSDKVEKIRNESEERQKHKHKKKDRKEKKEEKHSKKEEKKIDKQPNSISNSKEVPVKEEKTASRQVDKSNLFGSPKSDSPSTPKEPEIKVENNTQSIFREDESSNDSVKLSSKEASPAPPPRVPSKSPSPLPPPESIKKPEPEKKKEPSPKKKEKKEKKKDKKIDKEKDEKRKKRKSDSTTTIEAEPPEKVNKVDEIINSDEESKVSSTEDTMPVVVPPKSECDMDMLRELQRKIMSLKDNADLQRVVQLIAETGQYEVSAHTFDFDLCLLDRSTVRQLQDFFSTIS